MLSSWISIIQSRLATKTQFLNVWRDSTVMAMHISMPSIVVCSEAYGWFVLLRSRLGETGRRAGTVEVGRSALGRPRCRAQPGTEPDPNHQTSQLSTEDSGLPGAVQPTPALLHPASTPAARCAMSDSKCHLKGC